jgi:hypothetical protein
MRENYSPPGERLERRFDLSLPSAQTKTQEEAAIDKYDYLLVFPIIRGPYLNPLDIVSKSSICWEEIATIWKKCIPGSEEKRSAAVDSLNNFFQVKYFVNPKKSSMFNQKSWQAIAREAIVERLCKFGGLQLKLTADSERIFCRIRAPVKLLEKQADQGTLIKIVFVVV